MRVSVFCLSLPFAVDMDGTGLWNIPFRIWAGAWGRWLVAFGGGIIRDTRRF